MLSRLCWWRHWRAWPRSPLLSESLSQGGGHEPIGWKTSDRCSNSVAVSHGGCSRKRFYLFFSCPVGSSHGLITHSEAGTCIIFAVNGLKGHGTLWRRNGLQSQTVTEWPLYMLIYLDAFYGLVLVSSILHRVPRCCIYVNNICTLYIQYLHKVCMLGSNGRTYT